MTRYEELKESKTELEMATMIMEIADSEPWSTFYNENCKDKLPDEILEEWLKQQI